MCSGLGSPSLCPYGISVCSRRPGSEQEAGGHTVQGGTAKGGVWIPAVMWPKWRQRPAGVANQTCKVMGTGESQSTSAPSAMSGPDSPLLAMQLWGTVPCVSPRFLPTHGPCILLLSSCYGKPPGCLQKLMISSQRQVSNGGGRQELDSLSHSGTIRRHVFQTPRAPRGQSLGCLQ